VDQQEVVRQVGRRCVAGGAVMETAEARPPEAFSGAFLKGNCRKMVLHYIIVTYMIPVGSSEVHSSLSR
jgi:hypothetical protein